MDHATEEDDGRVGEATGEECGESGRGAVVRTALASGVSAWAKGLGEDMWEEVWEEGQSSERRIW